MTRAQTAICGAAGGVIVVPFLVAALIYAERRGTDRNRAVLRKAAEAQLMARKAYEAATEVQS